MKGWFYAMLMLPVLMAAADAQPPVRLYVAPNGNDNWSGRLPRPNASRTDGPLATLQGARDAVRRLKSSGRLRVPVHVQFAGGSYPMTEPVVFTPEDSGTVEAPIIYAFSIDGQLQRPRVEPHLSFTFERNIVYWKDSYLLHGSWKDANVVLRRNLYWRADGQPVLFGDLTWEEWRKLGKKEGARWGMKCTLPNSTEHRWEGLASDEGFEVLTWVGFVSNATEHTAFHLDDIELTNSEPERSR